MATQHALDTQLLNPAAAPTPGLFDIVEQAKREWEATADALSELIFLVDRRGYILRANRTMETWGLGDVKNVKGADLHTFLHSGCTGTSCTLATFLASCGDEARRQSSQDIELYDSYLRRYLQIRIDPVPSAHRLTTLATVVVVQDITRRKQAERALQDYTAQLEKLYGELEQVNRELQDALRAKDEMIQNVSHELRTPLTLIDGYMALLQDGTFGPLAPEQDEALDTMAENSRRLRKMVDLLFDLRKLEERKLMRVDLDLEIFLYELITGWHARFVDSGVRLELELEPDLPLLSADSDLLTQVVNNLLDNALKFSSSDSQVTVRAYQSVPSSGAAEHLLVVSDQGIGVPADKLERIFDRFYQVDGSKTRRFGGMGIGLALCRKIIELHGGRIWAESDGECQGSRFYVALPSTRPFPD